MRRQRRGLHAKTLARDGPSQAAAGRIGKREWGVVATILVLALAVPAACAAMAGTFGIPHSDDFTFSATALDFRRTGDFHLGGDEQMVLIGHVLWGQPFLRLFGAGVAALHLAGLAAAAIGLGASFMLLRRSSGPRTALLGTACLALLPGYALLAGSFMTDVTAFAAQMVCLALAMAALDRRGRARAVLLSLSFAAGVAAFSSRQTALAAPVAVGLAVVWQSAAARRAWRAAAADLALLAGALSVVVALALWRFNLPGQAHISSVRPTVSNLLAVLGALSTLALFVTPLSWPLARSVLSRPGRHRTAALAGVALLPWLMLRLDGRDLLLGNLLTRRGANDGVIGGTKPDLFAPLVWSGLQLLALLGLLALLVVVCNEIQMAVRNLRRRLRSRDDEASGILLTVFTVLAFTAAVAPAARGSHIFDRYLWPAAAGICGLLARRVPEGTWRRLSSTTTGSLALLVALIAVTAVSIGESIPFDGARWKAGEHAVRTGVPAGLVDAGYEWTGHHSVRPVRPPQPEAATAVSWWSRAYSAGLPCVVVLASPLADNRYALERTPSYDPLLSPRRQLFVYRLADPCATS